VYMWRFCVILP